MNFTRITKIHQKHPFFPTKPSFFKWSLINLKAYVTHQQHEIIA